MCEEAGTHKDNKCPLCVPVQLEGVHGNWHELSGAGENEFREGARGMVKVKYGEGRE